jgi:hypothetical protein
MFHRLSPSPPSARLLHFGTFTAIIVIIATAVAFALQLDDGGPAQASDATSCGTESWPYRDCGNDAAEQSRSIRLISSDRIQKTTVYTTAARVETSVAAPIAVVEPVLPEPAVEKAAVPPHVIGEAPLLTHSISTKIRAVSPRARAEAPRRARERIAEQQPAPSYASREKSYTGAGSSFDAVH